MTQLVHALRTVKVAQAMHSEIGEPRTFRQPVDDEIVGRTRQHGLSTVRQIAQPHNG